MNLNLIVASGAHEGEVIPIRKFPFVVGRIKECHLHAASEFVSRRHCQISCHEEKFYVADLDSTNGTFLNGLAVGKEEELSPGDCIHVGPLEFTVDLQTEATSAAHPPDKEEQATAQPSISPKVAGKTDEDSIAAYLLGAESEDQEGSGEDTTEKASVENSEVRL